MRAALEPRALEPRTSCMLDVHSASALPSPHASASEPEGLVASKCGFIWLWGGGGKERVETGFGWM